MLGFAGHRSAALRRQLEWYEAAFARSPIAAAIIAPGGEILASNEACRGLLDRRAEADVQETSLRIGDGDAAVELCFLVDRSEIRQMEDAAHATELHVALEREVSLALGASQTLDESMPAVLQAICEYGEWAVGAYWSIDRVNENLYCRAFWCTPNNSVPAFQQATEGLVIRRGEGLVGRAWAQDAPLWMSDIEDTGDVLRGLKAQHGGLTTAVCLPVPVDGAVHGVLEFWSRDRREAQSGLLETMASVAAHVGMQAGRLLEQEQADRMLRASEERFRTIAEMAKDAIITIDVSSTILSANRAAEEIFGYDRSELVGANLTMLMPEDQRRTHLEGVQRYALTAAKRLRWSNLELTGLRRDGSPVLLELSLADFVQGETHTFTAYIRDITDRKRNESILLHQALHDALTDLPNRTLLLERLERTVATARRYASSAALLFMDLDRFKEVNDTFGHHCGDQLLCEVARRLSGSLRESDTVARLGGDEFGILLPITDEEGACLTATRILELLQQEFVLEGHHFDIGASIGIAVFPNHGADADSLMRRADASMYAAKRGGSGYAVYSPDREEMNARRLLLTTELRHAIDSCQLRLDYQPKIALRMEGAFFVEALARWQHPERGLVPPAGFIPLAEETGLVKPLTLWVLNEALRQHRVWLDSGLNVRISVNVSARTLHEPDLVEIIGQLLADAGVAHSALQIEITESALMLDPDRALETLVRLRNAGLWTSIDDFGAGYSSLGYLKQLPVDEIKIDKSFVLDMARNRDDASIVRSVVTLGHNLGLQVVAEGVENQRTLDMLTEMNCDLAQGFYISHPLSAGDATEWLFRPRQRRAS